MRDFILLADAYTHVPAAPVLEAAAAPAAAADLLLEELADMAFRLRAHAENEHDDEDSSRAIGVEDGMSRAAEMIQNLIQRHRDGI